MTEYIVDVSLAKSWDEVVATFNRDFLHHFKVEWNGNLDAFNDYLFWPEHPYRLIVKGWNDFVPNVRETMRWDGRPNIEVLAEILETTTDAIVVFS